MHEGKFAKALSNDAKIRRKRRHQTRKALIVLDYTVEALGGLIMLVTNLSGTLYQHRVRNIIPNCIALSFGTFIYAGPIPLAYLIGESRVRDRIIAAGWIEGIKSIFYSSETILNLEREKIVNALNKDRRNSKNITGKNNSTRSLAHSRIEGTVKNMSNDNANGNPSLHTSTARRKILSNDIIPGQDVLNDETNGAPQLAKRYAGTSNENIEGNLLSRNMNGSLTAEVNADEIVVTDIEYVNEEMLPFKTTTTTTRSSNSNISRQDMLYDVPTLTFKGTKMYADHSDECLKDNTDTRNITRHDLNIEAKKDEIVVVDLEHVNEEVIPSKQSTTQKVSRTKRMVESKITEYAQSSSINTAFEGKSGMVLRLLQDANFKSFSRKYVLKRMLNGLNENMNEVHYIKYIEHLCYLENYHQKQRVNGTEPKLDFVVALLNAWYLSKKRASYQAGKTETSTSGKEQSIDITDHKNRRDWERRRTINQLLSCVSTVDQYTYHLQHLCNLEKIRDEQDIARCWET